MDRPPGPHGRHTCVAPPTYGMWRQATRSGQNAIAGVPACQRETRKIGEYKRADRVLLALPVARIAKSADPWRPAWIFVPAFAAVVAALFLLPAPSFESDLPGLLPFCDLPAGEQLVLGGNALSPDVVLAAVLEDGVP